MILQADNLWTLAVGTTPAEDRMLWDYLSAREPGYWFSDAYKRGVWDGKTHLYDRGKGRFPTGLLRMVLARARELGMEVQVQDRRMKPTLAPDFSRIGWLRGYQRAALRDLVLRTRGICQAPPGAGKSELFVAGGVLLEVPWLVLVDTRDLMQQAADRFRVRTGELAGRIGDGVWEERRFTVATVQTLDKNLDDPQVQALLERVRGVVFDECHLASGKRNMQLLMSTPNAYYRWGFSATPTGRKDNMELKAFGALGPICHRIEERELVEAGAIADASVRFVRLQHDRFPSWPIAQEDGIIRSEKRNALVVGLVARAARPTLVHARRLEHVRALVGLLRGGGLRVESVQGSTHDRAGLVRKLEHRDLDVLVVSKVFNKGVDIPEARSMVNAAGGDSVIDAVQLLGRAGRALAGRKSECEYWDVMDEGDPILRRHARHRFEALQARGWRCEVLDSLASPGAIPLPAIGG